uniref:Uncharacterized protein n=1 Tax=Pectinophora gossypiella TaxID=13191 RepID=A0A1E1WEK9_PECGO
MSDKEDNDKFEGDDKFEDTRVLRDRVVMRTCLTRSPWKSCLCSLRKKLEYGGKVYVHKQVHTWDDFQTLLRDNFAPKREEWLVYMDITQKKQESRGRANRNNQLSTQAVCSLNQKEITQPQSCLICRVDGIGRGGEL